MPQLKSGFLRTPLASSIRWCRRLLQQLGHPPPLLVPLAEVLLLVTMPPIEQEDDNAGEENDRRCHLDEGSGLSGVASLTGEPCVGAVETNDQGRDEERRGNQLDAALRFFLTVASTLLLDRIN